MRSTQPTQDRKDKSQHSLLGKRGSAESDISRCPASSARHGESYTARTQVSNGLNVGPLLHRLQATTTHAAVKYVGCCNLRGSEIVDNESTQGDELGTYNALSRDVLTECRMTYGARALWSRNSNSSREGHVSPGRTGKPFTGRSGVGNLMSSYRRYSG